MTAPALTDLECTSCGRFLDEWEIVAEDGLCDDCAHDQAHCDDFEEE